MTPRAVAGLVVLLGALMTIAAAAWLIGPIALLAGGVILVGLGLFAIDTSAHR